MTKGSPAPRRPPGVRRRPAGREQAIRRAWATAAAGAAIVVTVVVTVTLMVRPVVQHLGGASPACTVRAPSGTFHLSISQARYAVTIAAVGERAGLPDHAVSVALATALQESRLSDLPYGDRDSLGLFQQRPSQGWGSAAQVQDPVHSAAAFYRALTQVPGWQDVSVATAAQDVQHSADPLAYEVWASEARALAEAFTGEAPAAFACQYPPSAAAGSASLSEAVTTELGSPLPGAVVSGTRAGWRLATWLVGRGQGFGVASVSYDGWIWTAASGGWANSAVPAVAEVTYTTTPVS